MNEENWKPLIGFEGTYEVSDLGRINRVRKYKNSSGGGIRKIRTRQDGYQLCNLSMDGECSVITVHRAVAKAFIPNPEGHLEINHKDGNTSNNWAANLEWCTRSQNEIHKARILKRGMGCPKTLAYIHGARNGDPK